MATIIGLFAGVALVLGSILMTSELDPFVDLPSLVLVVGGSICAALISFPMKHMSGVASVLRNCFFERRRNSKELVEELVKCAELARKHGMLALQNLNPKTSDPFLASGLQMVVDGLDPIVVENVLVDELEATEVRHQEGRALFENIGRYAPAFGMIGTLVGLVLMLKKLSDPSAIGPAMAVALLTTLYGALISNLIALPLAEKLGRRSREEISLKMIAIKGILAIQAGDNPRIVERKLKTFLPQTRMTPSAEAVKAA